MSDYAKLTSIQTVLIWAALSKHVQSPQHKLTT